MINSESKLLKLEHDYKIIIDGIKYYLEDELIAIVSYGSYGRLEGAFYRKGKKVCTYNDYDLLIIVKNKVNEPIIVELEKSLHYKLEVKWLDLGQSTVEELKKLGLSIYSYDLKYGSKVIYGDKGVLEKIPTLSSKKIPLKEIETLYFTRLWTLLGSLGVNGYTNGVSGEDSRFFRYQMAKAILAVIDILLIQKGVYHFKYSERLKRVKIHYSHKEELIKMGNWALREKISPQDNKMNALEIENLYSQVVKLFISEMFLGLSKYYKIQINSTHDIELFFYRNIFTKIRLFIGEKFTSYYYKFVQTRLIQSYIAEAYISDDKNKDIIIRIVQNRIKKIYPDLGVENKNWNQLRYIISEIRLGLV